MRKRLTASALLALAVLATAAIGQPPKLNPPAKADEKKAEKKSADSTDAAIAAALANDPDVKMARAKIQLAEAELAKARLAVAQKVTSLKAAIDLNKNMVEVEEAKFKNADGLYNNAQPLISLTEFRLARLALQRAQSALATSETELKLLTGRADGSAVGNNPSHPTDPAALLAAALDERERLAYNLKLRAALQGLQERKTTEGPIPERIRAALDNRVTLGAKGATVTFDEAADAFKKHAGLDVPIRKAIPVTAIVSHGEELSVGAWFQVFQDVSRGTFYVREYGLLMTDKASAPPDAPTLMEFWKQKPPAKEPKVEPAVKP